MMSFRTCPLCEATCGLAIEHDGQQVLKIRGDAEDVFSKGFICPKGAALGELNADPDRLNQPMIRRGEDWQEVDWDTAFAAVEAGINAALTAHGRQSLGLYLGNPSAHNLSGTIYNRGLIKALASRNVYSASTVDQMPKHVSSGYMFGGPQIIPLPDVDRTDYMLMLGANPWVSNGSLATAPDWPGRLRALRQRGGRLVVVDPLLTQTAAHADEHVAIRPGADAWFLAAIITTLFEEGAVEPGRLAPMMNGLPGTEGDDVQAALRPFTPERVADACGLQAADIRRIAIEFARAPKAVCYGRIGTCTQRFGTLASWLVDVLNAVTGNLDRPGGAMFPSPAHEPRRDALPGRGRGFKTGRWTSRVRQLPEVFGELPVATLADEITTPGDGQVKALITIAGNPVLSTPDGAKLGSALNALDFMVSIDPYLNETTRFASVILPPPPPLSRSHYDIAFYNLSIRDVANYSPAIFPLPDDRPAEWQIMTRLIGVLSGTGADASAVDNFVCQQVVSRELQDPASPLHGRDEGDIMTALGDRRGPDRIIDFLLRAGLYGDGFGERPEGLSLDRLIATPHGIDFGALKPRLPDVLKTASGRVELAPPLFVADLARLETELNAERRPLVLIGRRHLRSNNSWMHNVPQLMTGRPRCTALVHPDDARAAGVSDGETVRLRAETGEVTAVIEIDQKIRPGVISLPHGWGHDDGNTRLAVARRNPGTNVNTLASTDETDPLSGNAILNGIPVSLTAASGAS